MYISQTEIMGTTSAILLLLSDTLISVSFSIIVPIIDCATSNKAFSDAVTTLPPF